MTIDSIKELIRNDETRTLELKKTVEAGCFRVTFMRRDYSSSVKEVNGRGEQGVYDRGEQGVNDRGEQGVNDRVEQGVNDLTDLEEKIIAAISLKPDISLADIAHQLTLSRKNTHKNMASLQKKGIITRVGPSFGGKWIVTMQLHKESDKIN